MKSVSATELKAPDGGWGILVCFGMAMPFISGLASMPSFGLIFGDFLKGIDAATSAIAVTTGAFYCAFSFAGLFTGWLFQRFGLRLIGLIGALLYFVGSAAQIFVTSTIDLLFAFSLLQGSGFGLMVPTAYTTFNNYFVKKRVFWMSFAQTLIGVGTMFYPVVMQKLIQCYGFRGCLTILAAINAHVILGMLLMQPVESHLKRVHLERDQEINVLPTPPPFNPPNKTVLPAVGNDYADDEHHLSPLMDSRRSSKKLSKEDLKLHTSRASSITSLGNWTGSVVVSEASPEMMNLGNSKRQSLAGAAEASAKWATKSKWRLLVDFLDLGLLKQPIYVNIVLGISFALYSDIAFFTLQPLYLFELKFDKPETANIIAIGAAADLGSRVFLAVSAIFVQVPSRYIYLAGAFFTVFLRFVFLTVVDFKGMAIITAALGFLRTWVHVPLPLVFAEYLPKERFASGYALFMFLQGNIMFAIGPVVGALRDWTQDYILTFHCLNFFMALCAVPWLLEIIYLCIKGKADSHPAEHELK